MLELEMKQMERREVDLRKHQESENLGTNRTWVRSDLTRTGLLDSFLKRKYR